MDINSLPKVSIVLPTYNGQKYVKEAIESCLNQTHRNIELIIVDDGSTDATAKIVSKIEDSRIRFTQLKQNSGSSVALNNGFSLSTGEYLTWTSDDNLYESNAIEVMVSYLGKNKDVDFVYANYHFIDKDGIIIKSMPVEPPCNLLERNCIGPCFMYRRKIYEAIGEYNPFLFRTEEYEYWLKILKSKYKMLPINRFLYKYRLHPNSKTGRYGAEASFNLAMQIRDKYFKGYRLKKFFVSRFNILKGKFIWRKQWLKEKHPLIAKPLIFLKNELIKIK